MTTRKLLAAMAVGGLIGASIVGAPPAQALTVTAETIVSWGGSYCIPVYGPGTFNPYTTGYVTQCGPAPVTFMHTGSSGMWVGVDPDMGLADWVSCTLYINGMFDQSDFARAGDGHEATCLVQVP